MATYPVLVTTRYTAPGAYIGQIITPAPSVTPDSRIPAYVGVGSRFAMGRNQAIRRAQVFDEALTFPSVPPFQATLPFTAKPDKQVARIVKSDGTEVKPNQWSFVKNGVTGKYDKVLVNPEAFDPTLDYEISYQSDDRSVKDPFPIADLREIISVGGSPDANDYTEYKNFFADFSVTGGVTGKPLQLALGADNTNKTSALGVPAAAAGNTGTATVAQASSSAFSHDYNRYYVLECTAASGTTPSRSATYKWSAQAVSAGANNEPNVPLDPSVASPTFTISEASGGATQERTLELGIVLSIGFGGSLPVVGDKWTFNAFGPAIVEIDGRLQNTNQYHEQGTITAKAGNTGFGSLAYASTSDPSNVFNAKYRVICTAMSDSSTKATVSWRRGANGLDLTVKVGGTSGNSKTFGVVEPGIPNSPLTVTTVGNDVTVSLATDATATPISTLTEVAAAITASTSCPLSAAVVGTGTTVVNAEVAGVADVTNASTSVTNGSGTAFNTELQVGSKIKFSSQTTVTYTVQSRTATTITLSTPYTGTTTGAVTITEVSSPLAGGVNGTFTGKLAWGEHGERTGVSGVLSFAYVQGSSTNPTMTLSNGVVLTVTLSNGPFAVNDQFDFVVKAPRQFYQNKDDRVTVLTINTATNPGAGRGAVTGSFVCDTAEGSFGTFEAEDNGVIPSNSTWEHGDFVLAGNLLLAVRNMHAGPVTATVAANRHAANSKHTFSATLSGTINWSLVETTTETIAKAQIATDVLGVITGAPATPYIILGNVPESVTSVVEAESGTPISYSIVQTALGENTQYISFVTKPTVDVRVEYVYRGAEPTPGQIYYFTSKHVRPDELYNTPILVTSLEAGRKLLAPLETENNLGIMNEIAMGDIACPAIYVIQVKDADGDGLYTDVDFKDAIAASEAPSKITDLVVLSRFSVLADQLNSVNKMADPFRRRLRMTWVGAPVGTAVGSDDEPNTLVYLAKQTLQVSGENPAHGTRVLVAPTLCKRDVRLENMVTTEVQMDGSFVAGALAALVASYTDPASTVLRQQLPGFKEIQTYGDTESPTNMILGGANIVFFTDRGAGVYRIEEDVTVDTFAEDYHLINNMTQKMFVTKYVREQLDSKLIGLVVPSPEAGAGLVRGFLVQALSTLLGRGLIGRYQDKNGKERALDPNADVVVFQDESDPTLYHFLYAYFLRNEIKRLFGLFSVNTNDFGAGR